MEKEQILDISWGAIFKIFIAIFIFYFIFLTKEIALWFFFALTVSVLLEPAINFLKKLWVPRIIAALLVYFSIFGILGILIFLSAPVFISELKQLSQNLPGYMGRINPFLQQIGFDTAENFDSFTNFLVSKLAENSESVFGALTTFFGGLSSTLFILITAFFLSLENNAVKKIMLLVSPKKYEESIAVLFQRAQNKISGWFAARVIACIFVGVASFIVFYIFGIKYAFLLALVAGALNFVPYIGPWITALLIVIFVGASANSWFTALYALVAFTVVQLAENSLLTPLLMKKMADVPPVLVLVSLLVGGKVFGFLGVIFAVPVFGIIYEFLKEYLERRREGSLEIQ